MSDRNHKIEVTCRMCGGIATLKVNEQDMIDWKQGKLIQNAMPYLNKEDRELIISNTCGDCFNKLFSDF